MSAAIDSADVQAVLARLATVGAAEDPHYTAAVDALQATRGTQIYGPERAALGSEAPLAVAPETGRLLYALALARRPRVVVEFGTSLGVSTLYLAAALRDLGTGRLITTELVAAKAARARTHVNAAGLGDLVEIRAGDARQTLASGVGEVDLLFLDGSNDLYVPVLGLLEPRLSDGAVVIADLSAGDPHHERYRYHVGEWLTVELPLDAGVLVSVRR